MDRLIGKKIDGRYQLMELIGVGGMANVYKAMDVLENRVVAVKALREEYIGNEEFMRRFRNESKAIAVLSHPNIVRVYDVSLSDRIPSIVMEYIDGVTLKEYIEQERVLPWKEAVHFTVQILRALQHAHDNGIVHRDIKPQNIMLLSDGTIKITDFGIARFSRAQSRTITDRAIGSVHYISPEQARGEETDQKADIYSVGVMLYEMLTGKLPFEADTPVSVAIKQIESEATPPSLLNPSIPEGLEEITLRAMQKDPESRYSSAAEMLREIEQFKRNPSISFEYKYMTAAPAAAAAGGGRRPEGGRPMKSQNQSRPAQAKKSRPASARTPILPVLTGITIAFMVATVVFVAVMIYTNNPFDQVEDVELPNLVGMKYETVMKTPAYTENFRIQAVATEPNEKYEAGVIFSQSPSSVPTLKKNSIIEVKVSSGAQIVTLPAYAGQEASLVMADLKKNGLEGVQAQLHSDTVQEGYVIRTDPDANTQLPTGSQVTLYVSMGTDKKMVEVPDITEEELKDAQKKLANAGFQVSLSYRKSSRVDEGEIIRQEPEGGTLAVQGSAVTIVVSSGDVDVVSLSLMIKLPTTIKETVTITAEQDGVETRREEVIPSQKRVWQPVFQGEGSSKVAIYINGELYQTYELDFDAEGHRGPIEDNSANFVFEE